MGVCPQRLSTRALIKCWQLSVIRLHVQAAALSGVAHSHRKMRACAGRGIKSLGISAPPESLGSILAGSVLTAAERPLPGSVAVVPCQGGV